MPPGGESVAFPGDALVGLVRAVSALGDAAIDRYAVVGGIAVTARLGRSHRATTDVDAVTSHVGPPEALEVLLALPGAERDPTNSHRVEIYGTPVEILPVEPLLQAELDGLSRKQALFVAAHSWALETARPLTVQAGAERSVEATAPFATRQPWWR